MTKLTDNQIRQVKTEVDISDINLHSYLIDFDLQPFYAAKIQEVVFHPRDPGGSILEASNLHHISCAVVNDPDDDETYEMPDGQHSHDVIAEFKQHAQWVMNVLMVISHSPKEIKFDQEKDVYCLRNIRVNSQVATTAYMTIMDVIVKYTIEKITKADYDDIIEGLNG